ncbi:MAG: FAD-binding domain-containing protein [Hyphomonadaceae bacterium]|nr:FAD-binding domain-containing protein [Hyphomonadaceae bacterium]
MELGWLHNHARMWFASIWIFTLRLPWQLGAEFFFRHLIDADPASNTLSWRWVAGLHTAGKHYLARAANIRMNTGGRFNPEGDLDERALPLTEDGPTPTPAPPPAGGTLATRRVALLLTEEDLHAESWALSAHVAACAALDSPPSAGIPASRFTAGALGDGLVRAQAHFGCAAEMLRPDAVVSWAKGLGVTEIVTAYTPVGRLARDLLTLDGRASMEGLRVVRLQRPFDTRVWPHAKAGFFKLREKIPQLIAATS